MLFHAVLGFLRAIQSRLAAFHPISPSLVAASVVIALLSDIDDAVPGVLSIEIAPYTEACTLAEPLGAATLAAPLVAATLADNLNHAVLNVLPAT